MLFPFEVPFEKLDVDLDSYVEVVFSCLQSEFMTLPKGADFIQYSAFERGYEALKRATSDFQTLSPEPVSEAVYELPISLIVLRTMLGFTASEWAYLTTERTGVKVTQNAARGLERRIRTAPTTAMKEDSSSMTYPRVQALVATALRASDRRTAPSAE